MKNTHIVTISLFAVSAAFILVSVLVTLSGGKNKNLIAKKLRLGAIIIGMTTLANGCRPHISCYARAHFREPQTLYKTNPQVDRLILELKENNKTIEIKCNLSNYQYISYRISAQDKVVLSGNCDKSDEDNNGALTVKTSELLMSGIYKLELYSAQEANLNEESSAFKTFDFKII